MEKSERDKAVAQKRLAEKVRIKERRKMRSRQDEARNVWFGLGMFGVVGWSVAIPALIGIFVGVWIDMTWKSPYSWTLMLLMIGIAAGCVNAWFWVRRESRAITRENDSDSNDGNDS